jgi:hypothetical protein
MNEKYTLTFIQGLPTLETFLYVIFNPINFIFAVVMLFLFIRYRNRPASSQLLPSILVGIGILGTFTGIFIGLISFDVDKIKESVPQLLEGLKIAFFTSIIGLILSAWIKVKYAIQKMKSDDTKEEQTGVDNMSNNLKNILVEFQELRVEQKEMLLSISKSLTDDLGGIINLLSELKEVSRDLHVAVTLAPELEERFSHLIQNSDNLIDVVTDNKNKIKKMTSSITDPYADGVLMILDKMLGVVREIKELPVEEITNNIKDYLKIDIGERSFSEFMDNIEAIEISTSQILDKLITIKKT